ncbi:hypothetical protein ABZ892_28585 [Streptomyces sp. NPDC046924]|uniref:hypothetical protein n=1 Tax=Streptomyces sp. NPDC046924 TaxID=3155136 RepID=UPI0033F90F47
MTGVVDSDELVRRIQRARARAAHEERLWRTRSAELERADPAEKGTADMHRLAYEAVLRVLDEILTPGKSDARG